MSDVRELNKSALLDLRRIIELANVAFHGWRKSYPTTARAVDLQELDTALSHLYTLCDDALLQSDLDTQAPTS